MSGVRPGGVFSAGGSSGRAKNPKVDQATTRPLPLTQAFTGILSLISSMALALTFTVILRLA